MPPSAIRSILARSSTSPVPRSCSASWWGLATVPVLALLLGIRIGIEEKALRMGLEGYDHYASRVRWRLIPLIS